MTLTEVAASVKPLHKEMDRRPSLVYVDVSFPEAQVLDQLDFRNYYTGSISVFARISSSFQSPLPSQSQAAQLEWTPVVENVKLMSNPHMELDAQKVVHIAVHRAEPIRELRIYLFQPSPFWKEFRISQIKCLRNDLSSLESIKEKGTVMSTSLRSPFSMSGNTSPRGTSTSVGTGPLAGMHPAWAHFAQAVGKMNDASTRHEKLKEQVTVTAPIAFQSPTDEIIDLIMAK
eukprot:ANDGO_03159.mRNA.1 hypothetical protein